ncbi:tetratricopeptide repeat protein [Sanguibacteroides justesenii]|uniref:Uncharacterized protein n=1 Tax=Sanguibacteroides justesenii TaxID=1547597 RepID=A0A0C3M8W6_9PORP|nr:hypothetical protein [Sanguibacteroides justesenii]KIO42853.1 hypothetical protein BA92_13385 [Sanguibacteroides justesenii]
MKRIAVLAFGICILTVGGLKAQSESKFGKDSIQTLYNASIYTELWRQKNFKEALPAWRYVFLNAPAFQQNTYVRGEDIIEYMYKSTQKKEYLDTLMMIYDQRIKYFGDDPKAGEGYILGRKGLALLRYGDQGVENRKQAYNYLLKSVEMKGNASLPDVVDRLMCTACELAKEEQLSADEVLHLYDDLSRLAKENILGGGKIGENFEKCQKNLDAFFFASGLANCETLAGLLTARYEANKTNLDELKGISSLLRRRECTDLPIYTTVAETIYQLEPSSDAAYGLAVMFLGKRDIEKAERYFKEAIDKAENVEEKENIYMMLSQLYLTTKNFPQAKKYAQEVLKINPNSGKAYILIGKAYVFGSKGYSQDDFEQHTVFWAAVDKFIKAKQVDPEVLTEADELIKTYSVYFPTSGEAFFNSIKSGDTVKIGGWINENTVARFNKE